MKMFAEWITVGRTGSAASCGAGRLGVNAGYSRNPFLIGRDRWNFLTAISEVNICKKVIKICKHKKRRKIQRRASFGSF
jgi:hypothetical protein